MSKALWRRRSARVYGGVKVQSTSCRGRKEKERKKEKMRRLKKYWLQITRVKHGDYKMNHTRLANATLSRRLREMFIIGIVVPLVHLFDIAMCPPAMPLPRVLKLSFSCISLSSSLYPFIPCSLPPRPTHTVTSHGSRMSEIR